MKKLQIQFQSESGDKTKSIDFDLYDLPVVNRFVDLLNDTKPTSFIEGRVDVRRSNTSESTLSLAAEMNTVVDTVNTLREDLLIDESLKLDLDIEPHLQVKKLNKLHEIQFQN